jgi:hypothetical protein
MAKTGEEVDDHGWHHRTVAKSSGGERREGGDVFIVPTRAHRAAASRAETKRRKFSFLGGLILRALKSVRAGL